MTTRARERVGIVAIIGCLFACSSSDQAVSVDGASPASFTRSHGRMQSPHILPALPRNLLRAPCIPTSVIDSPTLALGGTPMGQALANRQSWTELLRALAQT